MNITEIKSGDYRIFGRQTADKRTANIASACYIEQLARQTGMNIGLWNIHELFGEGRGHSLVKDKNEINKRFFVEAEKLRSGLTDEIHQLERALGEPMRALFERRRQTELQRLINSRDNNLNEASSAAVRQAERVKTAWEQTQAIERFNGGSETISVQLADVLRAGFWGFLEFNGTVLMLKTQNDIVLTEINPAAGLNLRVNLGRFKCKIDLAQMRVSIHPHENNLDVEGYLHPHVTGTGGICWGNASGTASQLAARGEVKQLLILLASLLSSYSAENPYRALLSFARLRPQETPPPVAAPVNGGSSEEGPF